MMESQQNLSIRFDAISLLAGSIVNGVAAYLFTAIGIGTFGAAGFAPVSIVWPIWALTVAVVTFPLQHWTIRAVVSGNESEVRSALRGVATVVFGLAGAVFPGSYVARSTLFGSDGLAMPVVARIIVVDAGLLGSARELCRVERPV